MKLIEVLGLLSYVVEKGKEELVVLTRVRTVNLPHGERNAYRCTTAPIGQTA